MAQALGAAILSVPVGLALSVHLNARLSESWFHVETFPLAADTLRSRVSALLLIPFGAYPGFRHVRDLDVSLALRHRQ
jgi:hypothetical protein